MRQDLKGQTVEQEFETGTQTNTKTTKTNRQASKQTNKTKQNKTIKQTNNVV